jgi:type I restriction enzyme S subunit
MVLAQDLRDAVLQAALQGKLTEQLDSDSSVDGILNSIKEKQIKLIEEKQIRRKKTLPPIKDVPFDIPDNWKLERMQNILNIRSAVRVHQTDWRKSGVPFFRAREIVSLDKDGYVDNDLFIDEELYEKFKKESGVPKKDDLMISGVGTLGNVYIVKENDKFYYKDASVLCFENIGNINAEYIKYALKSPIMLQQIYKDAMGTTVATLTIDRANAMIIPFPPIEEQQRIVDRVNELMEKIDDYEKVEKELIALEQRFPNDMKNALLQAAMQGKLTEQLDSDSSVDEMLEAIKEEKKQLIKEKKIKKEKALLPIDEDEIPFDIPQNWRWERFANIAILNPRNSLDDTLEVSFIPMTLISDGYNNEHTAENRIWKDIKKGFTHIKEGDLGFAKITPCFQNRKSVIFKNLVNGYAAGTTELHIIRTIPNSLLAEYLLWFVKSPYFIEGGVNTYTGTAGQQRIHKDYLPNCLVPVPPVEEQQRIVERLELLLPLCETL